MVTKVSPDQWVRSGAAQIAVSVQGSGQPILALHAGVCDRRSWQWCAQRWTDAGYRTIAYDRRGFGDTRYEAEPHDSLADLRAVSEATQARPAVVVGNSMGGMLAIDLALTHPEDVRALVLIGSLPSGAPSREWKQTAQEAAAEAGVAAAMQAGEQAGDVDPLNRAEVHYWLDGPTQDEGRVSGPPRDLMLEMNARALAAATPGDDTDRPQAWPRLNEVRVPTLLLVGEHDETGLWHLAEMMAARLPAARVQPMAGTAHCPMLDQPDELASLVVGFLAETRVG